MKKTAIGGSIGSLLELKIEAANIRRALGELLEFKVMAPLVAEGRDLLWQLNVCAGKSPVGKCLILEEAKQLSRPRVEIEFSEDTDSEEDQFVTIYREVRVDNVRSYIPSDCKDWRWERIYGNKSALFKSDIAYLCPALHMAIYLRDTALSKEMIRSLQSIGYSFTKIRNYLDNFPESCKRFYSHEVEHKILSAQRRKGSKFSAVDKRGRQILEKLINALPEVIEYTFEIGTVINREDESNNSDMINEDVFVYENCRSFTVTPDEIRAGALENQCKGMRIDEALLLCSRVKTLNGCEHIPLVYFNYPLYDTNWIRKKLMLHSTENSDD